MNPNLLVVRPRWATVAAVVSERLGKVYGGDYVQQVSAGTRVNSRVKEVLRDLGVMKDQLSKLTPTPAPKSKRSRAQSLAA